MPALVLPHTIGTLSERPVASLLIYALDTRLTGSVTFNTGTSRHAVYFENGRPCQAHTPLPVGELSRVLLDLDLVGPLVLDAALERCGEGEPLALDLVAHRHLSPGALATARIEQLERRVRALVTLPATTTFALYFDHNLVPSRDDSPCCPCDPLPLILDAIRINPLVLPIATTLQRFSHCIISVNEDAPIRELGFRLEQVIIDALTEKPRTLKELIDADLTSPSITRIAMYALLAPRCVPFGRTQSPPLFKPQHASQKRHDSYPPPRMSGFFERRPVRPNLPRRGVKSA
jgi:hypothetical protein